jgi:hypothetical protein
MHAANQLSVPSPLRAMLSPTGREQRELRHAHEIRRLLAASFDGQPGQASTEALIRFVDLHRVRYGVGALCAELPISPARYYDLKARAADAAWRRLVSATRSGQLRLGSGAFSR